MKSANETRNLVQTSIKAKAALIEKALANKEMAKPLTLEKWAQSITTPSKDKSTSSLNLKELSTSLDIEDLKTPEGLAKFLKKPLGKRETTAAMMEQALIQKEKLEEIQLQQREHLAFMHRLKALLFMLFFANKSHASDLIKEINRLVQEKLLHKQEPEKPSSTKATASESFQNAVAHYEKALHSLAEQEELVKAEEAMLQQLLENLALKQIELEAKHQLFRDSLKDLDHVETNKVSKPELDKKIADLFDTITVNAFKVSKAIANEDPDTNHIKHHHHGLNLQMSALKEILDVHLGLKHYTDEQGEKVTSFEKAHFILKLDQKIVKHDNKYYLLKPEQDFSLMNQQEKEMSLKNFEENKHDLMCIKQQLVFNETMEKAAHSEQVNDTKAKLENNKAQQLLIENNRNLIQSEMASAKNLENQPQSRAEMTPKATPTAGNASTPKPAQTSTTQLFREKVIELRNANREYKLEDIMTLAKLAPEEEKAKLKNLTKDIQKNPEAQKSFSKYLNNVNFAAVSKSKEKDKPEEKTSKFNPTPFKSMTSPY